MKRLPISLLILIMAFLAVGAFFADRHLPMWRDTIFHCVEGGAVRLPSGIEVPTNRWVALAEEMGKASLLQIGDGKSRRHNLIQNYDSGSKSLLVFDSGSATLVVTKYRGSEESTEFWVERE